MNRKLLLIGLNELNFDLLKKYTDKLNHISTKEGRKEIIISLRDEIKKAVKKDRYLSKEEALLLNQFIKKIQKELRESEN